MVLLSVGMLLKSLDIYGHKVGVHYKGESAYKTRVGGFLSLVTYVLVLT